MDNKAEQTQAGVFRARALLFDMDGTLVDSSPNVERAYRWWAKRHNLSDESILAVQTGRPHREVMAQFAPHLDLDYESAVFTDFEVADEEGMPLIAGAAELVRIAQKGRWAVVTSAKRRLAEMRFRVTGLPLPDVLVTADLITRGKPDPECYLLAASLLHIAQAECLIFEDAVAGIEAARRASIPVIGVNSSGTLTGADLIVGDFTELNVMLDQAGWFTIRRV